MKTPTLTILVGAPAAGKSRYCEAITSQNSDIFVVSTDAIREELFGDASAQNSGDLVFKTAYQRTKDLMSKGFSVIFDSTAAKPIYRKKLVEIGRESNAYIVCVNFKLPLEIHLQRNRGRKRFVPQNIIEIMHSNTLKNPPVLEEGFDEIIEVND